MATTNEPPEHTNSSTPITNSHIAPLLAAQLSQLISNYVRNNISYTPGRTIYLGCQRGRTIMPDTNRDGRNRPALAAKRLASKDAPFRPSSATNAPPSGVTRHLYDGQPLARCTPEGVRSRPSTVTKVTRK
jgi:hypothetical protein